MVFRQIIIGTTVINLKTCHVLCVALTWYHFYMNTYYDFFFFLKHKVGWVLIRYSRQFSIFSGMINIRWLVGKEFDKTLAQTIRKTVWIEFPYRFKIYINNDSFNVISFMLFSLNCNKDKAILFIMSGLDFDSSIMLETCVFGFPNNIDFIIVLRICPRRRSYTRTLHNKK